MMLGAVPPSIRLTVMVVCSGSNNALRGPLMAASALRARKNSINSAATITALTPRCGSDEWASCPVITVRTPVTPLWAVTTFMSVGSPTTTALGLGSSALRNLISDGTPMQPTSSSYENAKWIGRFKFALVMSGRAANAMATNAFMSAVPRPYSLPSFSVTTNGSECQS